MFQGSYLYPIDSASFTQIEFIDPLFI